MKDARQIIWWHFSDIHWEVRASTERKVFMHSLVDDLRKRVEQHGVPDFVILSGDLSSSGEESQLLDLEETFLKPIISVASNPQIKVLIVPGNHDLRRATARTINPELVLTINSSKSLNDFLDSDELILTVDRPFAAFEAFCRRVMPRVEWDTLGWWQEFDVKGAKVLAVGANSAWASSYHKDHSNSVDDERHLFLGQKQLRALVERSRDAQFTVLIVHHPLGWLSGFNESQIKHVINRHADFVLFGHTHTIHDLSLTLSAVGGTAYLPAPATYDRGSTDSIEYAQGYNIVTFDPSRRKGEAYYFKYSDVYATKFSPFVELYASDQTSFSIDFSAGKSLPTAGQIGTRFVAYSEILTLYPGLMRLSGLLERYAQAEFIERHALDLFESLVLELISGTDMLEPDAVYAFCESFVLTRFLLIFDLQQLVDSSARSFRPRFSSDSLLEIIKKVKDDPEVNLQLTLEDYQRLFVLSLDDSAFSGLGRSQIPDLYRRLFWVPWVLSRLILYCDYPELTPSALPSESRIADLFGGTVPEEHLTILGYRFDSVRCALSIDLKIRERDGFLAVTMLKHYVDAVIREISETWRNSQRVFPPLTLTLEFPRWRNKQIAGYYLTVETTPIVKLLMGKAMYRDAKHVWFRELVQNALDANSARRALDDDTYKSHLSITFQRGNLCVISDNGIGMSRQHILRYLTTLGRSIWNSDELHEGKPVTKENAIRAIGQFGIGFAAVFQEASRVSVRTRFFRDTGEPGWLVEFISVDKPFLLDAIDTNIGTDVEVQLNEGISQREFINLANEFFLYVDENVTVNPEPSLPRKLAEVSLTPPALGSGATLRDHICEEQIGPYRFTLRCLFCYEFRGREKEEKIPTSRLIVTNSGVRVFEQVSLILKPGKRYIWVAEDEEKPRYEKPDDSGLKHYWIVVDFEKSASPVLPSRLEIEIDQEFSKRLLEVVHDHFCDGLRSAIHEICERNMSVRARRKAILSAMTLSTVEENRFWGWRDSKPHSFSKVPSIDKVVIQLYGDRCPVCVQGADGEEKFESISNLKSRKGGVFVVENVAKSSLFKVYAKAAGLDEWILVEDRREFFLFGKAMNSVEWNGFVSEKSLYTEGRRIFSEVLDDPLIEVLRGDYALISDEIFDRAAFIVLPANLPGSWRRGEAAATVRKDAVKNCPARVLVNTSHPLIESMSKFLRARSASEDEWRLLKLLVDNLCDGVIEQDRITIARERWKSLQVDFRKLLGKLPAISHESLIVRR